MAEEITLALKSDSISAFPAVRRNYEHQKDSRQFNEKNIVSIVNRLSDNDSFIITPDSEMGDTKPIEFVVGGYYFKVNLKSDITSAFPSTESEEVKIYAYITLDTGNDLTELAGQDIDDGSSVSRYYGVQFTNKALTASSTLKFLTLLTKPAGSTEYAVPTESREKFTQEAVEGLPELQSNFDTHADELIPGTTGVETKETIHTTSTEKAVWNSTTVLANKEANVMQGFSLPSPQSTWTKEADGRYSYTLTVTTCKETDNPIVSLNIPVESNAIAKKIRKYFGYIYRADTQNGSIKFYSYRNDCDSINLPLSIKGISES